MVRSAYLALSSKRFTAQFDFAVSNSYSYDKYIPRETQNICITFVQPTTLYKCYTNVLCLLGQHRWVRRDGLISALVTTSSPRLKARA